MVGHGLGPRVIMGMAWSRINWNLVVASLGFAGLVAVGDLIVTNSQQKNDVASLGDAGLVAVGELLLLLAVGDLIHAFSLFVSEQSMHTLHNGYDSYVQHGVPPMVHQYQCSTTSWIVTPICSMSSTMWRVPPCNTTQKPDHRLI
jgi:hypothetical protein